MNNLIWLLRATRWVRRPPSRRQVITLLAIVAAGLIIAGLEHGGLWPDWAQLDQGRAPHIPR